MLQRFLERIGVQFSLASPARPRIAERAWLQGSWKVAFQLAPTQARAAWLSASGAGTPILPELPRGISGLVDSLERDEALASIGRALEVARGRRDLQQIESLLGAMALADQELALDTYASVLQDGLYCLPRLQVAPRPFNDETAARLVNRVGEFGVPSERSLWLLAVAATGADAQAVLSLDGLDPEEMQVGLWVAAKRRPGQGQWYVPDEPSAAATARTQRGEFGPYLAFTHARMAGSSEDVTERSLLAKLGLVSRSLAEGDNVALEISRESPSADVGSVDWLWNALVAVMKETGGGRLRLLTGLYCDLLEWNALNSEGWLLSGGMPAIPVADILRDVMFAVQANPKPDVLEVILATEVWKWPGDAVNDLVYYLLFDAHADSSAVSEIYRSLVTSAGGLDVPLLIGPVPPKDEAWIRGLLVDANGAWHRKNIDAIAFWLALDGVLPRYRAELLERGALSAP